jgi:hypothetical protein
LLEPDPAIEDRISLGIQTHRMGSGQIKEIEPSGEIVHAIDRLGLRPTNAVFDPSGKLGPVVIEAEKGLLLSFPDIELEIPLYEGAAM